MPKYLSSFNISEKYKLQWYAPERTGSRKVAEILCFFDFKNSGKPVFLSNEYNFNHFSEPMGGYKMICNARNPYSRVHSIFRNFYQNKLNSDKDFKKYVMEELPSGQTLKTVQNPFLSSKPEHLIRLEHFHEDISKLPFVQEKFTKNQIEVLTYHEVPIFEWEPFYDEEMKKVVQKLCGHQFEMWGYQK